MTLTLTVLAVAAVAAAVIFTFTRARSLPDPVDPAAEVRPVVRRLARHPKLQRFLQNRLDRRTAGGLALTVGVVVLFAAALAVWLLLDSIEGATALAALDDNVAQWGVTHADSRAVDVLEVITYLGDTVVVLAVMTIAGLIDFRRHRRAEVFVFLAVVIGGEKLIVNTLKAIIQRDRPDVMQLVGWDGSSFPSGHSAAAAAAWPAVALVLGRGWSRMNRALMAAGTGVIALSVATSRALLGVHWLTDIVAGVVIGYAWFVVCAVLFGGRAQRLGDPVTARPRGTREAP
jgi:membrane-associated phospholipid phosphatase